MEDYLAILVNLHGANHGGSQIHRTDARDGDLLDGLAGGSKIYKNKTSRVVYRKCDPIKNIPLNSRKQQSAVFLVVMMMGYSESGQITSNPEYDPLLSLSCPAPGPKHNP